MGVFSVLFYWHPMTLGYIEQKSDYVINLKIINLKSLNRKIYLIFRNGNVLEIK